MRGPKQSELHGLLRDELTRRLIAAEWVVDLAEDTEPGAAMIGAFRRQVSDDFWATAQFWLQNWNGAEEALHVSGDVGVSYFPAYCLWPVLVEGERTELNVDLGELLDPPDESSDAMIDPMIIELAYDERVPEAATALIEPVLDLGLAWVQRHASVETLLDAYRSGALRFDGEIEAIATLLAASGRHDEARNALAEYSASEREEAHTREFRRFVFQLNRWLDAGGVIPEAPTEPVRIFDFDYDQPSREDYARKRQTRKEAFEAVRGSRTGKTRDQLREMLHAELAHRGVSESPIAIELGLDAMLAQDSPFGKARFTVSSLKKLADIGVGIYKAFHENDNVTPRTPEWMEPPPRASYAVRTDFYRDSIGVGLGPRAEAVLDRVFDVAHSLWKDLALVNVWLSWDPEPPMDNSRIAVSIGNEKIGWVEVGKTDSYRASMDAAAERGELPFLQARLQHRDQAPRYVVEIPAPKE